ncbi:biotin/lipoyl-containing protein, partial [Aliarcobacter lanthieri]|uniref:biotin/lipoyl-containing protein n=1 Tax=Aliarcobacter lanthieri TaxID=1355374 RepID=UPI003AA93A8F
AVNGNVWKIQVKEGDKVEKEQQIMNLEAMKMEIDITAPVAGTISKILVEPTKAVEEGQTLAVIA